MTLRVAAFTPAPHVPSTRFRVAQYIDVLAAEGISMRAFPATFDSYPPVTRALRPLWGAAAVAARLVDLARSASFDASLLQRSFISKFCTVESLANRPRVVDIDDAIHTYHANGEPARTLARLADRVICGNTYLADRISEWTTKIEVLPTGLDTTYYQPGAERAEQQEIVFGWIGSGANLRYLEGIREPLERFLTRTRNASFAIMSDAPARTFPRLPKSRHFQWSAQTELAFLQGLSVGLMPLDDSEWSRGKCSFKMLQYMACGKPVIVSPYGNNADVLKLGALGLAARTRSEWLDCLNTLHADAELRRSQGEVGRAVAVNHFDKKLVGRRLAGILATAAHRR
jgi:glycosyltransferase involved in cell wall biosynthesis